MRAKWSAAISTWSSPIRQAGQPAPSPAAPSGVPARMSRVGAAIRADRRSVSSRRYVPMASQLASSIEPSGSRPRISVITSAKTRSVSAWSSGDGVSIMTIPVGAAPASSSREATECASTPPIE